MRKLQLNVQDLEVRSFLTASTGGFSLDPMSEPQYPGDTALCGPSRMDACTD